VTKTWSVLVRTAIAIAGAMAVGGAVVAAAGLDPLSTFRDLVAQSVGSTFAIENSLLEAVPITLAALGVALALRAGLFNLGGEGQIYVGALAGVSVALAGSALPVWALLPSVLVAGFAGGAAWGALPGLLRARLGLSEIITTIMLNFIAFWIVAYLVRGPIQDPKGVGYPYTSEVVTAARLPIVSATVPVGILIAAAVAAAVWIVLERTGLGLDIKAIGEGEPAARFGGVHIRTRIVVAMASAGALAGLAGVCELSGRQYRLSDTFSPGWGFQAVAVALIGRGTALGTLAAGLFFGALSNGVSGLEATAGVPSAVGQLIEGIAVLFLIVANANFVNRLLRRRFTVRRVRVVGQAA
jgi:general nucleoside transport system permease protein